MTHQAVTGPRPHPPAGARPPSGPPAPPRVGANHAPGVARPGAHPTPARPPGRIRRYMRQTPGRLLLLGAVSVLTALLCGFLGFIGGSTQADALRNAADDTAQLASTQEARNALVAANATAANAFLVGGLESPQQRETYTEAIDEAASDLVRLAASNPADGSDLAAVNAGLAEYTGLIEQARANNRQGFPVGAAYLDQASTQLRDHVVGPLDDLVLDNANRAADDFSRAGHATGVLAAGILAIAVLAAGQYWLARRTHRVLNLGIALATLVLLVGGGVGAVVLDQGATSANDVRANSYAGTLALSQAYALANDARSEEAFTLIERGSGQEREKAFAAATQDADERLADAETDGVVGKDARESLLEWVEEHQRIRDLDDAGDWEGAVALAIRTGPDTPNAAFEAFSEAVTTEAAEMTGVTQDALREAAGTARATGVVLLILGIVAAGLAWTGIAQRLKEYR